MDKEVAEEGGGGGGGASPAGNTGGREGRSAGRGWRRVKPMLTLDVLNLRA